MVKINQFYLILSTNGKQLFIWYLILTIYGDAEI